MPPRAFCNPGLTLPLWEGVCFQYMSGSRAAGRLEERIMMETLDLKHDLKYLYNPPVKTFTLVDVPPMNFLMID